MERRINLNNLFLPLLGFGLVLLLWQISSKTWAPSLPTPGRTWELSKPYIVEPLAKRGEMDQGILR
ncbi:MAG TPA: nitrate ABC transporter, permease protein, partial [Candidatus Eisenbacteria bacterium]|nr:nitrate ABC transporter, permease protein [Candidatus Eisenbacteria bacterium]